MPYVESSIDAPVLSKPEVEAPDFHADFEAHGAYGWRALRRLGVRQALSAQLAAHPISTLVSMLALGGALGAGTYASVTHRHH